MKPLFTAREIVIASFLYWVDYLVLCQVRKDRLTAAEAALTLEEFWAKFGAEVVHALASEMDCYDYDWLELKSKVSPLLDQIIDGTGVGDILNRMGRQKVKGWEEKQVREQAEKFWEAALWAYVKTELAHDPK